MVAGLSDEGTPYVRGWHESGRSMYDGKYGDRYERDRYSAAGSPKLRADDKTPFAHAECL